MVIPRSNFFSVIAEAVCDVRMWMLTYWDEETERLSQPPQHCFNVLTLRGDKGSDILETKFETKINHRIKIVLRKNHNFVLLYGNKASLIYLKIFNICPFETFDYLEFFKRNHLAIKSKF